MAYQPRGRYFEEFKVGQPFETMGRTMPSWR